MPDERDRDTTNRLWALITKFFSLHHDLSDLVLQREKLFRVLLDFQMLRSYFQDVETVTGRLKNTLNEAEKLAPPNSHLWKALQEEVFEGRINQTYLLLKDVSERNR